ncbi:helix-turn-helix domain-containing protein [Lacrimispora sp.]|uniref:helix-turn-helix domain-containing protein n=1 Tax=Lacrimispora sp. TaxID=2719234 RepID=UPI003993AB63
MQKTNINVDFGNILKKTRETRKMTQEEFAEFCNVSRAYYGRLERGENSITLDLCNKISQALGISIAALFEDLP